MPCRYALAAAEHHEDEAGVKIIREVALKQPGMTEERLREVTDHLVARWSDSESSE